MHVTMVLYELHHEKTGLQGVRPGLTQIGLYSHRTRLEVRIFLFKGKRNCTIHKEKAKAVTAQLICAYVFTYAKIQFSHDVAYIFIVDISQTVYIFFRH